MTGVASYGTLKREGCLETAHCIEKVDIHGGFDVLAAARTGARPASCAKNISQTSKEIAEVIHVEFMARAAGARRLRLPLAITARLCSVKPGGQSRFADLVVIFDVFSLGK
jgi:hypothetical protein